MNAASICGAFAETSRRREVLGFNYHVAVAALPAAAAAIDTGLT
jgi:hypothetical protein